MRTRMQRTVLGAGDVLPPAPGLVALEIQRDLRRERTWGYIVRAANNPATRGKTMTILESPYAVFTEIKSQSRNMDSKKWPWLLFPHEKEMGEYCAPQVDVL
jgi:hypothetical protein